MTVEEEDTHRNIIREGVDFMIESKCPPPLIAYLVKFSGHIFYLDKLDYCISGVSMHCFPHI